MFFQIKKAEHTYIYQWILKIKGHNQDSTTLEYPVYTHKQNNHNQDFSMELGRIHRNYIICTVLSKQETHFMEHIL